MTATDGIRLRVEQWAPPDAPRFVVAISHGAGEHVGRYAPFAVDIGERGGLAFGPDHRGQGESQGPRGHIDDFGEYASDLRHVILDQIDRTPPEQRPDRIPWFLFAHSMGGLIGLTYLIEHADDIPLAGAVLSAPLLGLSMKIGAVKRAAASVLATLAPKLGLPSGIPPDFISRDPDQVTKYAEDQRRATDSSAGWVRAMTAAIDNVNARVAEIKTPLYWYAGTDDKIVDTKTSEDAFARLPAAEDNDQTFRLWEGYYHELHNEPPELRAPVIESILDWFDARVPDGPAS